MRIRSKFPPLLTGCSLAVNGLLLSVIVLLLLRDRGLSPASQATSSVVQVSRVQAAPLPPPELGPRHQLSYNEWVVLLQREAEVVADKQPKRLTVMVGDSLSLWFPPDLLPSERSWLNQGISGETTAGLLKRLNLFDRTEPETIFLLIGINDLIRGVSDETILANQAEIIRYLRRVHPKSQLVVQSILPHADSRATWEGKGRLQEIANSRIRRLNQQLETIATEQGAFYLDLHPLFTDKAGDLRTNLTTDGLHLSPQGYLVWRSALQVFDQVKLEPSSVTKQARQ